jgi:hypothetical protein
MDRGFFPLSPGGWNGLPEDPFLLAHSLHSLTLDF